jgi:parallel beta-helix repeat protein
MNTIVENLNLKDDGQGILIVNATNTVIRNVNASRNYNGIQLTNGCRNVTVSGNIVDNNVEGISISSGDELSQNVLVTENIVSNNSNGISIDGGPQVTVSNNTVVDNRENGIDIHGSNHTIIGNSVKNSAYGISLGQSTFVLVEGNNIENHSARALSIYHNCYLDTVISNVISHSAVGLYCDQSGNRIYHNSFMGNNQQVSSPGSANSWDDGYPSGGNYWSDFRTRYPNATEIDSSGTWNTPYVIDASNVDHYPLVKQTAFPVSTLWDPSRDSYSAGNYASSWSAGNCYGLSSTEILYFMHYVLGDMTYPCFPAQNPLANTTSQLTLPQLSNGNWTTLNNALLAVMFHQAYDPNNAFKPSPSENGEYQKLLGALEYGTPALLSMHGFEDDWVTKTCKPCYHAVVAWGTEPLANGTVKIMVSDPNVPQQEEVANYDRSTQTFSYSAAGLSFYEFEVVAPEMIQEMIQTSWQKLWGYELNQTSWWFDNWLNFSITGYNIVIADKNVTISSNGLQDYFTVAGNSTSFVCGLPGSSGIEEGNTQVYAIPNSTSFSVSDPTSDQSAMLIDHVDNESGQLVGYGYFLNVTTTQGSLDFTVTPSNSGLLISSGNSAVNLSATILHATLQNHSVYQASNITIDPMQTANFTVNNWQMLNETSPSPVTLIITPEFPLTMILSLFMIATILTATILRKRRR